MDAQNQKKKINYIENGLRSFSLDIESRELLLKDVIFKWKQGIHSPLIDYVIGRFENNIFEINHDTIFINLSLNRYWYIKSDKFLFLKLDKNKWIENIEDTELFNLEKIHKNRWSKIDKKEIYGQMRSEGFLVCDDSGRARSVVNKTKKSKLIDIMLDMGISIDESIITDYNDMDRNELIDFLVKYEFYNLTSWTTELLIYYRSWIDHPVEDLINLIMNELIERKSLWPYWISY